MPGEDNPRKGDDGARRAKRWLDATTRTRASWTNEEAVNAGRLEWDWPYGGSSFSLDIGGLLIGDPFDYHAFAAEVKNYSGDSLGGHFDDFLAKCFVVAKHHSKDIQQFMFMTWHPFRVKSWTKLCTKDAITAGIKTSAKRVYGTDSDEAVDSALTADADIIADLADRLWLVVLSEKQEQLLISDADRKIIVANRVDTGLM